MITTNKGIPRVIEHHYEKVNGIRFYLENKIKALSEMLIFVNCTLIRETINGKVE